MENTKKSPPFQLIDTLFLLLDAFGFFAKLLRLCLFEVGLFLVSDPLFYTLLVFFDHFSISDLRRPVRHENINAFFKAGYLQCAAAIAFTSFKVR